MQGWDRLGELRFTAVAEWAKRRNHWGCRGALSCHFVGKVTDSPFVHCRGEVVHKRRLVWLLTWIREQGDVLVNKPNLEYFIMLPWFNKLCIVDCHEYWACDFNFKMQMHTNRGLVKTFAGWHNVKVFAIPPSDRPVVHVPVP